MSVTHYEQHFPAEAGSEPYIVEVYDDDTRQQVDTLQDAYQAWLGLGNLPTPVNDAPVPEPVAPAGDGALVAVQEATQILADYAKANPAQALPIIEGLAAAVGGTPHAQAQP